MMKISRLYIKIFLLFLLSLILAESIMIGLIALLSGKHRRDEIQQYFIDSQVYLARSLIEEKDKHSRIPLNKNKSLIDLVNRLGDMYNAKVWITTPDNNVLISSFKGPIPQLPKRRLKKFKTFTIRSKFRRDFFLTIPLNIKEFKNAELHIFFNRIKNKHSDIPLVLILLGIGIAFAILLFPVSRFLTGPLKNLRDSAHRFADGDLTHRASISSNDEIGELGGAFNHMAETIEQMISGTKELTANISHELRSPLARMRILLELLQNNIKKPDPDTFNQRLNSMMEEIEDMDILIGRILLLSKLDLKEESPARKEVNVTEIVRELLSKYESTIRKKNIELKADLPKNALLVFADTNDIRMALSCLIDNAIKFSPAGKSIDIRLINENNKKLITLSNQCEPLTDEEMLNLFNPFFRAGGKKTEGTGLGLTIARKIITKYGGQIEAVKERNGIEFHVLFNAGIQ